MTRMVGSQRQAVVAVLWASCALAAIEPVSAAQAKSDVRGRLLRAGDRTPIPNATIEILELNRVDTTSDIGRFLFVGVPNGTYRVRIRRLGFHPFVDQLRVSPGDTAEFVIAAPEVRTTLPTVVVQGRNVNVPPRFDGPYRRAALGNGFFFTREHIEELNPRDLEAVMNRIPGVRMNDRGITFERCQGGIPSSISNAAAPPVKVQVWIDGYRMSNRGRASADAPHELIRSVIPSSIQLIEVYNGVSNIPAEFLDDACAVVVIWTKPH